MIDMFGDRDCIIGEMIRGKKIQQCFIVKKEKLEYINIEFATFKRKNNCNITIEIFDGQNEIISQTINASILEDNSYYKFNVNKKLIINKVYELRIYSPNGKYSDAITLKYGRPKHKNLWIRINGSQKRGELCCIFQYEENLENNNESIINTANEINKEIIKAEQLPTINTVSETKQENQKISAYVSKKPLLSIIIPTAKRLDHLKTCLDTLSANTENYEIIIVVNSPENDFIENVNKLILLYKNIKTIILYNYAGYVVPCNMGASISSGQYICILNDDVVLKKDWSKEMISVLQKDNKIAQVGASMAYLTKDFSFSLRKTNHPYLEGWCFIIPRIIYEKYGLFDPEIDFAYCEDSDFSTKLLYKGYKVEKINVPIFHLGHQTSKKDENMKKFTDEKEMLNKKYLRKKWQKFLRK